MASTTFNDLTSQTFGQLHVQEQASPYTSPAGHKEARWRCVCSCGAELFVRSGALRSGKKTSCGCNKKRAPQKNISGKRFSMLTAIEPSHQVSYPNTKPHWVWRFRCDCGRETFARASDVSNGYKKSCGCATAAMKGEGGRNKATHGHTREIDGNRARTRTYRIWCAMKTRCNNENAWNYKYYGGRGIKVCEAWANSYEQFLADMGEAPTGLSIDRIDPDANYSPENCRWADQSTQRTNRSSRPGRRG